MRSLSLVALVASAAFADARVLSGVSEQLDLSPTVDVVLVFEATPPPLPEDFVVRRRYARLPVVAGTATRAGLARLLGLAGLTAVQLDSLGHPSLAESGPAIHADAVREQLGVTGRGVTVAVLDTGVDDHHPDLDGGVVAQKCFVLGGCSPDAGDVGELAPEGSGHGTHVCGIVSGDGRVAPVGIAPDSRLVVVRVFNEAQVGRVSDWVAAMDWLLEMRDALGVRIANLSLGTNQVYAGACDMAQPAMRDAVDRLWDAGIIVFAAAGNDGADAGLNAPACLTRVIAVGATYDSDLGREPDTGTYACGCADEATDAGSVACFSDSSEQLDLLAPGSRIRSDAPGGGTIQRRGTSQASPHAAAVAALMLEVDPQLSPGDLERILEGTGSLRVDPKNGRSTPFVDARAAVEAVATSFCARHADREGCPLTLECDGGSCARGVCFEGQCAIAVPAAAPLKAAGCSVAGEGLGLLALLFAAVLQRRRLRRTPTRRRPAR